MRQLLLLSVVAFIVISFAAADTLQWSTSASEFGGISNSVSDTTAIYSVSATNRSITKLSLATGQAVWTQKLYGGLSSSSATVVDAGSALVVLLGNNQLFGVCRESGSILWVNTLLPTKNSGPPTLNGLKLTNVFSAEWLQGFEDQWDTNYTTIPEIQVFNASTGAKLWDRLGDSKALGIPYNKTEFIFGYSSNNGILFHLRLKIFATSLASSFSVVYVLDAVTGKVNAFFNGTTSDTPWSNLDADSPFFAEIAPRSGTKQSPTNTYFGNDYVVNLYLLSAPAQWTVNFSVSPANTLSNANSAIIIARDLMLVAYYPKFRGQKWLAAFDIITNVPLWNVTLPQSVTVVQQQYIMHGDNIVLALGGKTNNEVGPIHFAAFNGGTGQLAWMISAPSVQEYPLIFRAIPTATSSTDMNGLVIPSMMGWSRWAIDSQKNATTLEYNTVTMLSGMMAMVPAPNSTTDFIVISKENVARYAPTP